MLGAHHRRRCRLRTASAAAVRVVGTILLTLMPAGHGAYHLQNQIGCQCEFPDTDELCVPLESLADCQAAATALSIPYAKNFTITSNSLPGGCYLYKDYILYFNTFTNVSGAWYQGFHRNSLCELVPQTTTTPGPLVYDCDAAGVPRSVVFHRKAGTCSGTANGETCTFECQQGWRNKQSETVMCSNGTFVLSDPSAQTCTADADNDGFEYDMDDGATSRTASNKVLGCSNAAATDPIWSIVMGGDHNTARGCRATVIGGERNTARGNGAIVGGGSYNTAKSAFAAVGGGTTNTAGVAGAAIAGGSHTSSTGIYSFVGGGYGHHGDAKYAAISGGYKNRALQTRDSPYVGGGKECYAKGSYSTVMGGYRNTAVSISSSIGGGYFNAAIGRYAAVAGGSRNTVKGLSGAVMGHQGVASGDYSLSLAFKGTECVVRGDQTVGMCAEHIFVNGVDLIDELTDGSLYGRRRQLSLADLEEQAKSSMEAASGKAQGEELTEVRSAVDELLRLKDELAANDRAIDALLAELSH